MATLQVERFRCKICNIDFHSMEELTDHNVELPPGTMPDDFPADLGSPGSKR
jgi:hypothetical protein